MISTPESTDSEKRMAAHSMAGDASFSLAEECVQLCSEEGRAEGIKSEKKCQKCEEQATIKQRTYLLQKESDVLFQNVKMEATGFMKGEHNGIGAMYHLRTSVKSRGAKNSLSLRRMSGSARKTISQRTLCQE
jgi:hypothetical protein